MNKILEKKVISKEKEFKKKEKQLIKMQENTILSLLNLVENRDTDTGQHIKRTSIYIELLADQTKKDGIYTNILTDSYINILVKVAPMHDIGKIVVPDNILKKKGSLNSEEFDKIKSHAEAGGKIILSLIGTEENDEYVKLAVDVATKHHEKWDGNGYPNKISKEEIPLCARLMAIVDVFDALVSPRCYKTSMDLKDALKIINDGAGNHFDPVLVPEFIKLEPKLQTIINEYGG